MIEHDIPQSATDRFSLRPQVEHHVIGETKIRILKFCWKGKAHLDIGSECQDWAASFLSNSPPPSSILSVAVADGVGTRSRSLQGARFACEVLGRSFANDWSSEERPLNVFTQGQAEFVQQCLTHQRENRIYLPDDEAAPLADSAVEYATTALLLCITGKQFWAASVGDGAIYGIADGGKKAEQLTKILREGFANEVRPLTNANWKIGFSESDSELKDCGIHEGYCLMTDGLSECIGDANEYFGSVWPSLKERLNDEAELLDYLEAFCRFWEERGFSQDDKTMVAIFIDS
jgi:hypothetical protein